MIVPLPLPARATESSRGLAVNVAVTLNAWVITTVHVPVPEQPAPVHPANDEPAAGVAVSVTDVLSG